MVFSLFYVTSWYSFNTFFKAILSYQLFEAVFSASILFVLALSLSFCSLLPFM